MPRYIDADALVKRLKHSPLFLGTNMQFKDGVIDLVERQPILDVVPREEFDRLRHILNSYTLQHGTVKDQHAAIDRIKAETAREIFEEIDTMCVDLFGNFNHKRFAELKEKYTEDTPDGKRTDR